VIKKRECFFAIRDIEHGKVSDIPEGTQKPTAPPKKKERILNQDELE
jgi:hypothetical protein